MLLILMGYYLFSCKSFTNCFQTYSFLAKDFKKGKGLNFQPYPYALHLPLVTHPLAIILPPLD